MSQDTKKTIAVIDGNSWVHRAYHAVPPVMFLEDGTPTNAVQGFMNMFLSFYQKAQPDAIFCAFDAGIPKFRLQAVQEYKSQRKPIDNELRVQFPIVEEVLKSMDIPVIKVEGWEGDDVLGTISKIAEDHGIESLLVTGDKDANQLASNLTKIVNMRKGVSDVAILGPEEVYEKYGVTPDQFIDFLALMGDSSDNIPGVPGIGKVSAAKLLAKFNSIDGIYENLDQLKGAQKKNVENNKDAAYVSQKAATIARDVPLNVDVEGTYFPMFDKEQVSRTFVKYKLMSSLRGVLSLIGETMDTPEGTQGALSSEGNATSKSAANPGGTKVAISAGEPGTIQTISKPEIKFENFKICKEDDKFVQDVLNGKLEYAIAVSKRMPAEPVQTSLFDVMDLTGEGTEQPKDTRFNDLIVCLSDNNNTVLLEGDSAANVLKKCVLNSIDSEKDNKKKHDKSQIVVENSKDILSLLFPPDNKQEALITEEDLFNANIFDVSLAAYVLNSSKSTYSAIDVYQQIFSEMLPTIDANDEKKLNKKDDKYIEKKNANIDMRLARRAAVTHALAGIIKDLLVETKSKDVLYDIEKPLTSVLIYMERVGAKIDVERMAELSKSTGKTLEQLKSEIYEIAGQEFNVDSPKQLGHILFEVMGLPAKKKTKTGYSTNAAVLEDLSKDYELPKKIIQYREFAKIKSTYIDALPALIKEDGLIHTTYHQRKTTTGRLSSSDPNIQNIPTRSEFGNKIRECFIPLEPEHLFVSADYSQIELRMLAHLSEDSGLIEAFNSGMDFHTATAVKVFGGGELAEESSAAFNEAERKELRRRAKAVNFGIIYGQQAYGLAQTLKISVSEAKAIIDRYFETYPQVKSYLDGVVASAYDLGYAQTIFGRRRYIKELKDRNRNVRAFGERTAMNHPMQGSAADIIKLAMRRVEDAIRKAGLSAKCMMQVHDELGFSVVQEESEELQRIVKHEMENAVELKVPLVVDVQVGKNWAQTH